MKITKSSLHYSKVVLVYSFKCKGTVTWIYIAPSHETSKPLPAQAWITQFYCKLQHACRYLVSVHQMALPLTCDSVRLIAAYYSFIYPVMMKG